MKFTYETGPATLVQFIILSFLNIATGLSSVVSTCRHDGSNCTSNLIVSIIFYILAVSWFGFVCALGFAAQLKRSKRLAQLLIMAELAITLIALFNIKLNLHHQKDLLTLVTSFVDMVLAVWVIHLAIRLMKAGQGRVVRHRRRSFYSQD